MLASNLLDIIDDIVYSNCCVSINEIYNYRWTLINEIFEDVIHHHLEGSWAVGEAKEHDQGFEEALICLEGGLPLISLSDPYIVISPSYVQLCEVLGF